MEQHRRQLPVAQPRQAQGRAQPQRPVPPRHQRWHRIGRQGAVLAAQHRPVLHAHACGGTDAVPERIRDLRHPAIGAQQPHRPVGRWHHPRTGAGTLLRVTQGIGRIQDIDRLARDALLQDDGATGLRRKDHGMQAPALVHDQIFHPARRVGQERPAELRRGAPRGHLKQAPAAIAPGPHRAVGRHRHGQEPRRPGPHHALRDPLAHLVQPVAVREDEGLTVRAQGPHRQGLQRRCPRPP